jgi:hypothetical protein
MINHKATAQQWERVKRWAKDDESSTDSCTLELLSRIEALEAAQQPRLFTAEEVAPIVAPTVKKSHTAPAGSLVERVGNRMPLLPDGRVNDASARAAILEVAAWLRSEYPRREGYGTAWANLIEQEAER